MKLILNVLAVMALLVFPSVAQTQLQGDAPDMVPKVDISVRPLISTSVPLNEPARIDLGSLKVPGVSATLTQGVTVQAYTRYVDFKDQKIGQIVLVGIEKDGRHEALPTDAYAAQFDLNTAELDPAREVVIKGDGAVMAAALQRLSKAPPENQPEHTPATDDALIAQPQSGGGGNSENAQAASYKTPESVAVAEEATEAVRVTTAGCPIRIDLGQLRAIQQSKTETTRAGALISETPCSDSADGFDLQKSYTVCSDKVDLDARTATAQYVLFYVDGGGSRQEITECASDTEKVFSVVEKFDACTTFLDYSNLKAVPQSTLIYQNDNNAEVQVRGCQPSETRQAVPLNPTTNGCSIRHDFGLGKSYQQATNTYLMDGILYTAGGCVDDGTEYVHTTTNQNPQGGTVCDPIIDLSGGNVTLQSRVQINVNGIGQYITGCTPDVGGQLVLIATTEGCTNPADWHHDLSAAQSFGQERHYYTFSGQQNYVNDCQNAQETYAHQIETTGWQNHDDQLFAYPLNTIYINAPTGRYDIQVSQVQSGAVQMPYQLTGTATVASGTITYDGCDRYTDTQTVEIWQRPDVTSYEKPIGRGTPIGPTGACVLSVSPSWSLQSTYTNNIRCSWTDTRGSVHIGQFINNNGRYQGAKTLTREDGVVISTTNGAGDMSCGTGTSTCRGGGNTASCPNPVTSFSQITTWRNNLGWW